MKKLIFALLFAPFMLSAQELIDLSKYHDGNRLWEMTDYNFGLLNTSITSLETEDEASVVYHMFEYFGDSTVSLSYTTSWAHLTNTGDSLFIQYELEGFTISNDTITFVNAGDYDLIANFTHDGDNGETVSIRFYNTTTSAGIPTAGAQAMGGNNDYGTTSVIAYAEVNAGDKIVVQYKGDNSGTAKFKNGVVRITRLHE
jgi:hypothetical protein